jgi:hypothetical protein
LPADLKVGIFYAGPGTLWTDLKRFEQTMLGKLVSETQAGDGGSAKPTTDPGGLSAGCLCSTKWHKVAAFWSVVCHSIVLEGRA